ncbi:PIR Superfamily Protein [Plasmodium ovale curtisi]|uniref:PIR Superfamily Protein n=1 Tax=Plasmodium ovale curtisi TaxID=864141 RepID=A0A1A8X1E5_PLAOA|nr:PIR Superfamily Protein [Plasmodium ovale curtisi]
MADEASVLNELPSLSFDYQLDNLSGKCDHCNSCHQYGSNLNNKFFFQLPCHRLVKNIEYIRSTIYLNGQYVKQKRCEDFIYWMANNVNKLNVKKGKNEINDIINELINIWRYINGILERKGIDKTDLCDITNIELPLNLIDLKQKKMMSDYCENFDKLYTKLTNNKNKCNIFYNYFMDSKEAYDLVLEKCHKSGTSNSSCPYFCRSKRHDPKIILDKLNCTEIPAPKKQEILITQDQCNAEKDSLTSRLEQAMVAASNPAFNYSDPRSVFLILFTFWGTFLTFYFLYKVTPFGSFIRNNLLKKKLVKENFDELVDDESVYDYSESVNRNMQNVGYKISYNSD